MCFASSLVISSLPVVGRGEWICFSRSLGTMRAATMGFQGPKPLTHPQFAASKSHWLSSSVVGAGAPGFPLLWRGVLKSLTHRRYSSPFGSLSKRRMDTGIRPGERREGKEWVEGSEEKMLLWDFCICSLQAAELVSRSAIYKWLFLLNSSSKARHAADSLFFFLYWEWWKVEWLEKCRVFHSLILWF